MTTLTPAQEPHILSNQALRFVAEHSADSVFSVRVCPRSVEDRNNVAAIDALDKLVRRLGTNKLDERAVDVDAEIYCGYSKGTGFSIGKAKDCLTILTVSHLIEEIYYAGSHLTAGCADSSGADSSGVDLLRDINTAFQFDVLCVHQERLLKESNVEDISKLERWNAPATVIAIDTRVDLLALKCQTEQVIITGDKDYADQCPHHDSFLALADLPPPKSEMVLLQGWPYLLSDFKWWGKVSVSERPYNTVDRPNKYGYQMKLIEIPQMKCVDECSGGPVVVGAMAEDHLSYAGVYFKSINNSGYAVSLGDIKLFLTRFGLLEDSEDAHAAYEHLRENNHDDQSGGEGEEDN